jgi:carbon storage regulator CsrA
MLVLSRQPGEEVRIGDQIKVHSLQNSRRQVRPGITAPVSWRIDRHEVRTRLGRRRRPAR